MSASVQHPLMSKRRRPALRGVALAVVATLLVGLGVVLTASSADAHAVLVSAEPADRAQLDQAPSAVTLTFNETVELTSGGLRVFDANAERVDGGTAQSVSDTTIEVALPDTLDDGGYVVVYRVISADSHAVGGVLTFTVGDASEVGDGVVAELFGGSGAGPLGWAGRILRGLGYMATLLAAGAALFALFVAPAATDRALARRWGVAAALSGAGLALLAIPVQAGAVSGLGLLDVLTSMDVLGETVTSSFGLGSLVRAGALVWVAVLWRPQLSLIIPSAAGLVALASYLLDGHQRTFEPTWLMMGGDLIHLVAAAAWLAGLILLAGAMRRRRLADDPMGAATLVARFSTLATVAVLAVIVGGVAMAIPLVGSPAALTSTTYGLLLLAKIVAAAIVALIGGYNRQQLVPAITARMVPAGGAGGAGDARDGQRPSPETAPLTPNSVTTQTAVPGGSSARTAAAWKRLHGTVRVEAGIILAILLLTGGLVSTQPASDEAGLGGYYQVQSALTEELEVDLVVDPNRAGLNTVHVYILDETGRPSTEVEDLIFELTYVPEGIGPIPIEPFFAGPGHWIATIEDIAFPGEWEVRVVAGVDRFSEATTTLTVPVAP